MSRERRQRSICQARNASPSLERRDRGALGEDGHARGGELDQVLDHLAERRRRLEPADAEAGHRPVLRQRLDEQDLVVRRHHVVERGRAGAVVGDAAVDLVGDDPKPMPARDRQRRGDFLARRDEAGRVGGRVEENEAGRRRHRARELVRIEAPAAASVERGRARRARRRFQARRQNWARPARGSAPRRPGPTIEPGRDLDRVHAADGDEEILGREGAASGRCAIDARHIGRDRRAQFGDAALRRCRTSRRDRARPWPPR